MRTNERTVEKQRENKTGPSTRLRSCLNVCEHVECVRECGTLVHCILGNAKVCNAIVVATANEHAANGRKTPLDGLFLALPKDDAEGNKMATVLHRMVHIPHT